MADGQGEMIPSSIQHLCRLILRQDLPEQLQRYIARKAKNAPKVLAFEWHWRGGLIVVVLSRLLKLIPNNEDFTSPLSHLEDSAKQGDDLLAGLLKIMLFVQKDLPRFFTVSKSSAVSTIKDSLSFVFFLLDITSDELLLNSLADMNTSVKDEINILRQGMAFLIASIEEISSSTQLEKRLEAVANRAGKVLHALFFNPKPSGKLRKWVNRAKVVAGNMEENRILPPVPDVLWRITPWISWHWKGRVILLVLSQSIKWSPDFVELSQSLKHLQSFADGGIGLISSPKFLLFVQTNLKQYFSVLKSSTEKTDLVIASFISLLLDIKKEVIMHFDKKDVIDLIKDQIEMLCKELQFLDTLSSDHQFHHTELEEAKSTLIDGEPLVNHIGNFFHFLIFSDGATVNDINLKLSDIQQELEAVREKIKAHCILISELPAQKNALGLGFIDDSLLDYLENLMDVNANIMVDVNDQIRMLHHELIMSRPIVKDLKRRKHIHVERFEQSLMIFTNLAQEAECLINYFADQELPLWYFKFRLSLLIKKMEVTRVELEELNPSFGILNEQQWFNELPSQEILMRRTKPSETDDFIVGHGEQATQIADQLLRGSDHRQLVSIIGMPGLGKTTMARKMYHNRAIVSRFDRCVWYGSSQVYDKSSALIDIYSSLEPSKKRDEILKMEDEIIAEEIYKSLKGRRYLIVLDDVWDIRAWDDLQKFFPDDENGSRILITSRFKDVCIDASADCIIQLPFLLASECWELLQKKAFGEKGCPAQLNDIGKGIAAHCEGLPLAVVTIAGVLADRQEANFWEEVSKNLSSYMSQGPTKCMDILDLSYKHLPLHLKPCFLYIAAFPQASKIQIQKLISLWIAEGLIPREEEQERTLEDIAESYLVNLVDRSLIIVEKRRSSRGIKSCRVHDLVRDLCLRIAHEERFINFIHQHNCFSVYQQQYRLCSHSVDSVPRYSVPNNLQIRSMLGCLLETFQLKFLSVLDIRNIYNIKKSKLEGIKICIHLRYLAVPYWVDSMSCLHNLQFLLVDESEYVDISVLLKLGKLRAVIFDEIYIGQDRRSGALKDVCHQHLHTLSHFVINNEGDVEILKCFPHLRKLKCNVSKEVTSINLEFLTELESISLSGYSGNHSIIFPQNLKELRLEDLEMMNEDMLAIGKLPFLEFLKLKLCQIGDHGKWDTGAGEFQQLRVLKLQSCPRIEEWNILSDDESSDDQSFPILERLVLIACEYIEIPSCFGTHPTLQVIEIDYCGESVQESAKRIREEQLEEMGNELNLTISSQ